ncbi:membrane-spanning protein [Aciduricibacillus chroicocephali]|uniref:Membrane-spanning protein n=1 Tax=Aciduricibacillus chroicocephali TaxID=3054939 RepID=A0ABY9KSL3_9BACI|nr:membrane-spanning protein [Bacillaceae bacterium 44XB]
MRRKTIIIFSTAYVLLMAITFIIQHMNGDASKWTDTLGRVSASLLPLLLLFMKRIPFPVPLIISYYLLIFCTFYLGATIRLYDKFKWWDTGTHVIGGIFMSYVAATLYKIMVPNPEDQKIPAWLLFLFALSFSMFASVMWEVVEFAASEMGKLEADSQKDTMTDLIAGLVGGVIAAILIVITRKKGNLNDH